MKKAQKWSEIYQNDEKTLLRDYNFRMQLIKLSFISTGARILVNTTGMWKFRTVYRYCLKLSYIINFFEAIFLHKICTSQIRSY